MNRFNFCLLLALLFVPGRVEAEVILLGVGHEADAKDNDIKVYDPTYSTDVVDLAASSGAAFTTTHLSWSPTSFAHSFEHARPSKPQASRNSYGNMSFGTDTFSVDTPTIFVIAGEYRMEGRGFMDFEVNLTDANWISLFSSYQLSEATANQVFKADWSGGVSDGGWLTGSITGTLQPGAYHFQYMAYIFNNSADAPSSTGHISAHGNASITFGQSVPESSTLVNLSMLGIAGIILGWQRRRRRAA